MPSNPNPYADYRFSEYNQSHKTPTHREIDYADPRFYQPSPYPDEPVQAVPGHAPDPAAGEYVPAIPGAYRGPANLEGYTTDPGTAQRQANRAGSVPPDSAQPQPRTGWLAGLGGLSATLALLLKFGFAGITALVSIGVYSLIFGWQFAIGLVALLFIHESGHALVMKLKGIPIGGMIFIPLFGAAVTMTRMPRNAKDEAEVGIAGPVAGALAASFCLLVALAAPAGNAGVWAPLAYFGFLMNLFNLIPVVPFDGGRVLAAIDKRVWLLGFVALVVIQIWQWVNGNDSFYLLIFIVMAAPQLWTRRDSSTPQARDYYAVPWSERIVLGLAYFGLAAVLVLGMSLTKGIMPH